MPYEVVSGDETDHGPSSSRSLYRRTVRECYAITQLPNTLGVPRRSRSGLEHSTHFTWRLGLLLMTALVQVNSRTFEWNLVAFLSGQGLSLDYLKTFTTPTSFAALMTMKLSN